MAINKPQTDRPPKRVEDLEVIARLDGFINFAAIARATGVSKSTLMKRINRHTDLTSSNERKAFAYDVTELLEEIRYELNVALGYEDRDRHYQYKYLTNLPTDHPDPVELEEA